MIRLLTRLSKGVSAAPSKLHIFSAICRTFRSGGTRIRTGDTMIFSHFRRPLGMRIRRIGKGIYVHGVPLDTSWFCPYCCATVDTAFLTPQRHRKQDTYIRSPSSSIGLLSLSGILRRCIGMQPQRDANWVQAPHQEQCSLPCTELLLVPQYSCRATTRRGSGLGRRKSCGLPLGRDLLRELPLRYGMLLPHFRAHDPCRRRALASGADLNSTVWALTALVMYIRAHRQEHSDLKRPDDVARQS